MKIFFVISFIAIAICIILCILRAVLGPRFTDRLVCANLISTKIVACIVLTGTFLHEEFVFDTALIYAMIGFVAVTVLGKMFAGKGRFRDPKEIAARENDEH